MVLRTVEPHVPKARGPITSRNTLHHIGKSTSVTDPEIASKALLQERYSSYLSQNHSNKFTSPATRIFVNFASFLPIFIYFHLRHFNIPNPNFSLLCLNKTTTLYFNFRHLNFGPIPLINSSKSNQMFSSTALTYVFFANIEIILTCLRIGYIKLSHFWTTFVPFFTISTIW